MRRRQLLKLLGTGAVTWPFAVDAQQQAIPVVGFLSSVSPGDAVRTRLMAFRQGLAEAGYVEGRNVTVEYRWAEGKLDRLPELAADLVRHKVAVIVAPGSEPGALAAKAATTTIPIVFGVAQDPVALGLVASLARPGGNATGINFFAAELAAKRLEWLREMVPQAARVGALINPANTAIAEATLRDVQSASRGMGLTIHLLYAASRSEIDDALAAFARERVDAVFVGPDPFFNSRRMQLAIMAVHHRIPAVYAARDYVEAGGLMSYGTNIPDMFRQVGGYAGRILKGAAPADLPVVQATKFEFLINQQAAIALGLVVPDKLLVAAEEVIE